MQIKAMNHTLKRLGRILSLLVSAMIFMATQAHAEPAAKPKAAKVAAKPAPRAKVSSAPMVIGVGPALFAETTKRTDEHWRGGELQNPEEEPSEWENVGAFNLQAWFLAPVLLPNLRLGGGLAWYNSYTLREPRKKWWRPVTEQEKENYELYGHTFQLWLQPEYSLHEVIAKLSILIGLRGGAVALFASEGGTLDGEIQAIKRQGFNVSPLPTLGLFVGPHLGATWPLAERVIVRADVGVTFSRLWLYDAKATDGGFTNEEKAAMSTTRTQVLLGLEFVL
jgi:hypothetical protein